MPPPGQPPTSEALLERDVADEIGVVGVDAGVDDGDGDAGAVESDAGAHGVGVDEGGGLGELEVQGDVGRDGRDARVGAQGGDGSRRRRRRRNRGRHRIAARR